MQTRVTRQFYTETAHRLLNYNGHCSNIHGHSYRWLLTFEGEIKEDGFVIDFKKLKDFQQLIESTFDHALVLYKKDPLISVLELAEEELRIIRFDKQPTVENMAEYAKEVINLALSLDENCKKLLQLVRIEIFETVNCNVEVSGQ